jgi:hypothetical protein
MQQCPSSGRRLIQTPAIRRYCWACRIPHAMDLSMRRLRFERDGQLKPVRSKELEICGVEGGERCLLGDGGGGNHGVYPQATQAFCGIKKAGSHLCLSGCERDDAPLEKSLHSIDLGGGDRSTKKFIPSGSGRAKCLSCRSPSEKVTRFQTSLDHSGNWEIRAEADHSLLHCFRSSSISDHCQNPDF